MDELNKILQQQSEKLMLTPSPGVWAAVERDIEQRERKRRWLIWLLLLVGLVIAGLSIYTVYATKSTNNKLSTTAAKRVLNPERSTDIKDDKSLVPSPLASVPVISRPAAPTGIVEMKNRQKNAVKDIVVHGTDNSVTAADSANANDEVPISNAVVVPQVPAPTLPIAKQRVKQPGALPMLRQHQPAPVLHQDIHTIEKDEVPAVNNAGAMKLVNKQSLTLQQVTPQKVLAQQPTMVAERSLPEIDKAGARTLPNLQQLALQAAPSEAILFQPMERATPAIPSSEDTKANPPIAGSVKQTTNDPIDLGKTAEENIPKPTQEPPRVQRIESRWSLAINISPNKSFSKIRENSDSNIVSNSRNAGSVDRFGANYGIRAGFYATPALQLYAGIGIQNISEQMDRLQVLPNRSPFVPSGNIGTSGISTTKRTGIEGDSTGTVMNRFRYLEMPLGVRFRLLNSGRFSVRADAGITINRLIHSSGYKYDSLKNAYLPVLKQDMKPWLLGYGAGLSIQYDVLKHISLQLMPYYRRYAGSVYKNSYLDQYFQQAGINFSIQYRFLKAKK